MFSVPEETPLTDPSTLMKNLLAGAATFRGYPDGAGTARLLEAAAHALQQQVAETKVQRGLAIASQTLASELSVKCERMQARLELASGNGYAAPALLHDGHLRGAEVTPAVGPAATPSLATPSACAYGADMAPPSAAHMHSGHPMPSPAPAHTPSLHSQQMQLQQLQAQQAALQQQMAQQAQQQQPPPMPTPAALSTPAEEAERLGPRAFKTWTQDTPSAPPPREMPTGGGGGGGGGYSEADPSERAVEAMVDNLKQRFRQSGVALPLEKHSGTVYRLGAKKLSLNIRSSRLMVRVGGGYCDFLEYLSKASI